MRFSVVTPSFKQLRWLKLCLSSVADQQGVDVEHIIQDAHSGKELEDWVSANSHAKLVVESDSGMYDAINRGFLKATGDIVAWLNCDEQYLPGTLAKVADFFRQNPTVEVLFGDAVLLDSRGEILSFRKAIKPSLLHTQLVHLNTLSCATFVRRTVLDRGLFLDDKFQTISDAVWVASMLKVGIKMGVLNEPLATFTFTGANLGQSQRAFDEGRQWRGQVPCAIWLKPLVVAYHRLRKFLAGAYQPRDLAIAVYTEDSLEHRVQKTRKKVPAYWPTQIAQNK